jgi:hypothetical protein
MRIRIISIYFHYYDNLSNTYIHILKFLKNNRIRKVNDMHINLLYHMEKLKIFCL